MINFALKMNFRILIIILLGNTLIIRAQIPDSLINQNDSVRDPKLLLSPHFGTGINFLKVSPDTVPVINRPGYEFGAGLIYSLSEKSDVELSFGFLFTSATALDRVSNVYTRKYKILAYGYRMTLNYKYQLSNLLYLNLGGSIVLNSEYNNNALPTSKNSDFDIFWRYYGHIGIASKVKIGRLFFFPELRFQLGLNEIRNYAIYNKVQLHYLSLLVHITNI